MFAAKPLSFHRIAKQKGCLKGPPGVSGCYRDIGMKKPDIAKRMARQSRVSPAEAADRLDNVVREVLADLRRGRESAFPGLGRFRQDRNGKVVFVPEGGRHA